jgi:bifunctional non-homologous end joining protein LigD
VSTTENSIAKRAGKVYIDPSQNDYADTLAAPYSVRPYHIPTVSTPLDWQEINLKLNPQSFTIQTISKRLKERGDLFKDLLSTKYRQSNTKLLRKLFR